jgi:hypothetical protein
MDQYEKYVYNIEKILPTETVEAIVRKIEEMD